MFSGNDLSNHDSSTKPRENIPWTLLLKKYENHLKSKMAAMQIAYFTTESYDIDQSGCYMGKSVHNYSKSYFYTGYGGHLENV